MNSQKHHYLHVFVCLHACVCEQKTVGMVGVAYKGRGGGWGGWGVCSEYTAAERICSIHSLRNRSRILPACVATCQNLSS